MTVVRENGSFVLATYVHDPLSRRSSLVYGNGTTQAYAWSQAGDLTAHTHTLSGTANTWTLGYSKAHQLVSEAASNAAWGHVASVDETTGYGAANSLNQYVTVTQGASPAVTLTHDANGNMTGEGTWAFAYDAENRLRTATRAGTAATYLYDPAGRRQAKVVNGVVTSFLSDGAEEIAEYTGAGGLLRRYVPGPGTDQPIAMITPVGAGQARSYFHVNRQGSTVAMSNDAGTVSEGPYTYDAYGQGASSAGVPFKYTGRRLDPETGLYYYRARYYSASLGRFLQTDPIGYADQMNLYGYVGNDPINLIDPAGLTKIDVYIEQGYMIVDPEQSSRKPYRVPISSGRGACTNNPSCSKDRNQGPIPAGKYSISSKDLDDPSSAYDWARNTVLGDWGDWRAPMQPSEDTDVADKEGVPRDGFFMHGGSSPGSAGCVDIGGGVYGNEQTDQVKGDISADPDGTVEVTVHDSDKKAK